ncbi:MULTISPECIES: Trp biosynthesis-associated membrane protein [Dietzia]|uniref:Trp biosynthesis-associated membrane protein n=1 Tax=Dietzia TaxID=37914 RepID=UPI000D0933F0|nr:MULTISPECIES: Trp biosynthesis-associated membrane protein [Dietzia]AVM65091.1 TIGR02234 family membrane protein [Dietzia sp. oral taxon 368]MCT1710437.1 Trp biosynthesis-associated membrane protein [Dietzia cinnamea]MCT2263719.1 Trp biosynthesis-associated membrane protein [Dietzia cinnamea]MCT2273335.1 Trp biosynthesis-associated membrane protein [Dietzia cinnamea]
MSRRARLLAPVILLLVGAALLWIASRMVWLDVAAFNDQSGEARRALTGAEWQPALVPLALGALAAIAAVALVRGLAARAVGAVIALLGAAAVALLISSVGGVDAERVHSVITSDEGVARTNAGPGTEGSESIPEWSRITELSTRPVGPALTGAGAAALLAAGLLVLARPARPVRRDDRYVTPAVRREEAAAGGTTGGGTGGTRGTAGIGGGAEDEADDDAGRDLWLELDEGRDPTS